MSGLNAPESGFIDIGCGTLQSTESTKDWDDKLTQETTDCMLSPFYPKGLRLSSTKTYTDISTFVQESVLKI